MTTKELTYVLTAAREKSFQTAAQKLQMSQSALSRSVQKIEAELGCPVFVRTAQGLLLTDAGRRYAASAQQILQLERELQADISRINNLAAGRLSVGVTGYLGTYLLPTLLRGQLNLPPELASFFGGTSLLIIVGVALDTLRQMESLLLMRHYDGFLKHGRLRGRK